MITIEYYTAAWDEAMNPRPPRVGAMVRYRADELADAHEHDAFRRCLTRNGLDIAYHHGGKVWDFYKITRGAV